MQKSLTQENGDPFLAAALVPAMRTGETLEISAGISPRLLHAVDEIQALYRSWDKTLSQIRVKAHVDEGHTSVRDQPSRVGLFFSCGVDSYYSLLKNLTDHSDDEHTITDLIVIRGFDIAFSRDARVFQKILTNARIVARQFRKSVVPVATNLRDFGTRYVRWGDLHLGSALASVALALQSVFREVYIASSFSYDQLFPWGTHPALDPLWSTERISLIHDGCEATRVDKTRFIAQFPVVTDTLRVCTRWYVYNCGVCEKCLRTMVALHIAGALGKTRTLPNFMDPRLLRQIHVTREVRSLVEELVANLGSSKTDVAIKSSLQEALSRTRRTRPAPTHSSRIVSVAEYAPPALRAWILRLFRALRKSPPSSLLDLLPSHESESIRMIEPR
jgi:hypothetical protein